MKKGINSDIWEPPGKQKRPKPTAKQIPYVRTKLLSLFSYFGLNSIQAYDFVSCLEFVDEKRTGRVDINMFCAAYLPTSFELFKHIFNLYVDATDAITHQEDDKKPGAVTQTLAQRLPEIKKTKEQPEYHYFAAFLIFLMSAGYDGKQADISHWIYWLLYDSKSISVSGSNLQENLKAMAGLYATDNRRAKQLKVTDSSISPQEFIKYYKFK